MKLKTANPLDQLEFWITSIEKDLQEDLISLACLHHVDDSMRECTTSEFFAYLDSSSLSAMEIMSRTLLVTRLIDFAFTGRTTEGEWQKVFDRHIQIKNMLEAQGKSAEPSDRWLANYQEAKKAWIHLYQNWIAFIANELSNDHIMEWFYRSAIE